MGLYCLEAGISLMTGLQVRHRSRRGKGVIEKQRQPIDTLHVDIRCVRDKDNDLPLPERVGPVEGWARRGSSPHGAWLTLGPRAPAAAQGWYR